MDAPHDSSIRAFRLHDSVASDFKHDQALRDQALHDAQRFRQRPFGSSRVLQERSSNPQYENFDIDRNRYHNEEPLSAHSSHSAIENEFPRRMVTGYIASQPALGARQRSKLEIEKDFQALLRHIHKCEAYMKYRSGQTTEKGANHQKWPEQIERAFIRALVRWEPMGRRKLSYKGSKPMGRNELIAASIIEWTNEPVKRKQVSSHIQVLKEKVKDDPHGPSVMHWLEGDHSTRRQDKLFRRRAALGYMDARKALPSMDHSRGYSQSGSNLPDPINTVPSNGPTKHENTLEPVEFDMYVKRDVYEADRRHPDPQGRMHTFAKSSGPRLPDLYLDETPNWRKDFPLLVPLHNAGKLNCDVIYAQASLELTPQILSGGAQICISFEFSTQHDISRTHVWDCRTRFYEGRGSELVWDSNEENRSVHDHEAGNDVSEPATIAGSGNITHYNERGPWLHSIPFGSRFWAKKLAILSRQLRDASKIGEPSEGDSPPTVSRETLQGSVRSHVKSIIALQEIFAAPIDRSHPTKRIAVIYWTFRQAEFGQAGRTSWRNLIPQRSSFPAKVATSPYSGLEGMSWDFNQDSSAMQMPVAGQRSEQYAYGLDDLSTMALAGLPHQATEHTSSQTLMPHSSHSLDSIPDDNHLGMQLSMSMEPSMPSYDASHRHQPQPTPQYPSTSFAQSEPSAAPSMTRGPSSASTTASFPHAFAHQSGPQHQPLPWTNYNMMFADTGSAYQHFGGAPAAHGVHDLYGVPDASHRMYQSTSSQYHHQQQQQQQQQHDLTPRAQHPLPLPQTATHQQQQQVSRPPSQHSSFEQPILLSQHPHYGEARAGAGIADVHQRRADDGRRSGLPGTPLPLEGGRSPAHDANDLMRHQARLGREQAGMQHRLGANLLPSPLEE